MSKSPCSNDIKRHTPQSLAPDFFGPHSISPKLQNRAQSGWEGRNLPKPVVLSHLGSLSAFQSYFSILLILNPTLQLSTKRQSQNTEKHLIPNPIPKTQNAGIASKPAHRRGRRPRAPGGRPRANPGQGRPLSQRQAHDGYLPPALRLSV